MVPDSEIIFKIAGSALSFLYYECDKSRTDQVGFLIGEKHSYIKKTISDSQMNGEKNETIIHIVAVLPVGAPFLFCNNVGKIDRTKLKMLLGPLEKDICGWYAFRRNSGLNPTLRETILHRELLDALPHITAESFVQCCIGSDVTQSRSTHRFRHVFLLHKNRVFEPISVPVINLGQPEDIGYRTVAVTTSSNKSFNEIASFIKLDSSMGGLAALKALQKPLQEKIMEIAAEVQQFDQKTQLLVNEIQELKNQNLILKRQTCTANGKKIHHEGDTEKENEGKIHHIEGEIQHEHVKDKEEEENNEVDELEKDAEGTEEKNDKDGEDSEEIISCSQKIDTSNVEMKEESSPVTSTKESQNSEKTVFEESPSNSQNFTPSQEY